MNGMSGTSFTDQVMRDMQDALRLRLIPSECVSIVRAIREVAGRSQEDAAALADRIQRMDRRCKCGATYGNHSAGTQECPEDAGGGSRWWPGRRFVPAVGEETQSQTLKRRLSEYGGGGA